MRGVYFAPSLPNERRWMLWPYTSRLIKNIGLAYDPSAFVRPTAYCNIYSPHNGLIAAYSTERNPDEPLHWSDVTFALWAAIVPLVGGGIENLRYIARSWVTNDVTLSIIDAALLHPVRAKTFAANEEAFLALLGTPNGVGVAYLLMQHKKALGLKTLSRVTAGYDDPNYWEFAYLMFEIVDMPPRPGIARFLSRNESHYPQHPAYC